MAGRTRARLAGAGFQVYHHMNGPSEFTVVGTLRDWSVTERLGEIRVPPLLTGGRHDECRPEPHADRQRRIPGPELVILDQTSRAAFAEERAHSRAPARAFRERSAAP